MRAAVVLGPGEGETVTDEPARFVQIKGAVAQLAVTESRYGIGESGPDPHVHRRHADCFWVLDGRLVFEVGGTRVAADAGTFVLIPPNVVHTFRNEGPGDARFLNLHAPSMGFDEHLRALARGDETAAIERFDTFDPPEDGGRPASDALVRAPGEGERIPLGASEARVAAGTGDGGGHLAVLHTTIASGFPGPVPHRHRRMADCFYVLQGALTLTVEGAVTAEAGSFVLVPPGTTHTFSNPGAEPARVLNVMAPAGLEGYLREVSATAGAGPPDPALMARIASTYDFEPER